MNDHEARIKALQEARQQLVDALLIMTQLEETTQNNFLKRQAEAIEEEQ